MSYVRRNYDKIAELRYGEILIPGTDQVIGEYNDYEVKLKNSYGRYDCVCRRGDDGEVQDNFYNVIGRYENGTVYDERGCEIGSYDGYDSDGLAAAAVLMFCSDDILVPVAEIFDENRRLVATIRDDAIYDSYDSRVCYLHNLPGLVERNAIYDEYGAQQGEIRYDGEIYDCDSNYLGCCKNGSNDDVEVAGIILTLMRPQFGLYEMRFRRSAILDDHDKTIAVISGDDLLDTNGYRIGGYYECKTEASGQEIRNKNGRKVGHYEGDGRIYDVNGNYVGRCVTNNRRDLEFAAMVLLSDSSPADDDDDTSAKEIVMDFDYGKVGSICNGIIFDKYGTEIGSYENGHIYDRYHTEIGSVDGSYVYDSGLNSVGQIDDEKVIDINGDYAGNVSVYDDFHERIYALGALILLRKELDLPPIRVNHYDSNEYSGSFATGAAATVAVAEEMTVDYSTGHGTSNSSSSARQKATNLAFGTESRHEKYDSRRVNEIGEVNRRGKTISHKAMVAIPWIIAVALINIQGFMSQMGYTAVTGGLTVSVMISFFGVIYPMACWRNIGKKADKYYAFQITGVVLFAFLATMDLSYLLWFAAALVTVLWGPTDGFGLMKYYEVV